MRRRNLLKKVGGTATALALAAQPVVSTESEVTRKISLNTARYQNLHRATVFLYEDGRKRVQIDGDRPADPNEAKGYQVSVESLTNASGQYTPEQATARLKALPASDFLQENNPGTKKVNGRDGSGADSGGGSSNSEFGTLDHGGSDGESNYEGGAWARSESPIANTNITEGWIDWTTSGGEVNYVQWKWHATPCGNWYIEDAGHSYTDFAGDDVEVKFYGDYYNYAYADDTKRTEAYHRLWTIGNPDGSMDWRTEHWHIGEKSGNFHVEAGYFSQYDQHAAGHC